MIKIGDIVRIKGMLGKFEIINIDEKDGKYQIQQYENGIKLQVSKRFLEKSAVQVPRDDEGKTSV